MIRFGSEPKQMRAMDLDDIFLSRLKLLIIMVKAYLDEYPLGRFRRRAIRSNGRLVGAEAADLGALDQEIAGCKGDKTVPNADRVFYENIRLLAENAVGFASGTTIDASGRDRLRSALDSICEAITFDSRLKERHFLKVA